MTQNRGYRNTVYKAIDREREYQDTKWGSLYEHPHTVAEWLLIMQSELDEAKEAWVRNSSDDLALLEILQVIAVGTACLEQHRVRERP